MTSDQHVQLLTASLTEPGAFSLNDLLERIKEQVEEDEPVAREWIAATRRVEQAGHLTGEQADGLVIEIAFAWQVDDERCAALLGALGYEALAHGTRTRGFDYFLEARKPFDLLEDKIYEAGRFARCNYPSWDDDDETASAPPAPGTEEREVFDEKYADELESLEDRWRLAVKGEGGWTVADAFAFDYLVAGDNEGGKGDLRISVIQRLRAEGLLDESLAWLLLDRLAEAMMDSAMDEDPVLKELAERKLEEEYNGLGPADRMAIGSKDGAGPVWLALDAAEERRTAMFRRRVLRAAGEFEMLRWMKEQPEALRRRVEAARKEWDLD